MPPDPSQFPQVHMELFLFFILISTKSHLNWQSCACINQLMNVSRRKAWKMQEICVTTTALHSLQGVLRELYPFAISRNVYKLTWNHFKRGPDLVSHLRRSRLDTEWTVPTLKDRLKEHLRQIVDKIQRLDQVQVRPPLLKPSAICSAGEDVLLCSDDESPNPVNKYLMVLISTRLGQLQSWPGILQMWQDWVLVCFGPVGLFLRQTKHLEPGKYA